MLMQEMCLYMMKKNNYKCCMCCCELGNILL
jgi:hypothetical protein